VSEKAESNPTLAEMAEGDILARIFPRLPLSEATLVGPGDDSAVLSAPDGRFVVTTDMMVQGPDFRLEWSSGFDLGVKAAGTNLSDVAAMGARPTALVVSIAAPGTTTIGFLEAVADGLRDACEALAPGCGVVGGDLSVSDALTFSVTAFGDLDGRAPILRSGARPGDVVAFAGQLGLAGVGLAHLFAGQAASGHPAAVQAQLAPRPPIAQGVVASLAGATAGMDVSDSLVMDAGRIARASNVVIHLDENSMDDLAGHLAVEMGIDASKARQAILFGGEDHALLMTFPDEASVPASFTVIGHVEACDDSMGPHVNLGGAPVPENGWNPYSGWNGETS
jgi:thiamine-monophosphate kinase